MLRVNPLLKKQGTPFRLHLLTQYLLRGRGRCIERARWTAQTTSHHSMLCVGNCGGSIRRQQGSARAALLASSHIDSNPNHDEEDVDGREDRDSQERREVPLRRAEQERREVVAERTVRRQAEHQAGRVFAGEGRERCGDPRRDQAGRRRREKQRRSPQNQALTAVGADTGNA